MISLLLLFGLAESVLTSLGGHNLNLDKPEHPTALLFLISDCPVANRYAPEVNKIYTAYRKQGFNLIAVYEDPAITASQATKHMKSFGYKFEGCIDKGHVLAKRYSAKISPEVVLLSKDGKVAYQGRIDDAYADVGVRKTVIRSHDLSNAIQALLKGHTIAVPRTTAFGCYLSETP